MGKFGARGVVRNFAPKWALGPAESGKSSFTKVKQAVPTSSSSDVPVALK